jgi:hypothetical protein
MFLAYAGMAVMILFGVVAIFTSIFRWDGKRDWMPTRTGTIIYIAALILLVLAGVWATLRKFLE